MPVTKRNNALIAAVALVGVSAIGAAGYAAVSGEFHSLIGLVDSDGPSSGNHPANNDRVLQYAVQDRSSDDPAIVPPDHIFHSGDRFRLLVKGRAAANIYAFYEDRTDGRHRVAAAVPVIANRAVTLSVLWSGSVQPVFSSPPRRSGFLSPGLK